MTEDLVPKDDLRAMARRAGYEVYIDRGMNDDLMHFLVHYVGNDRERLCLRDIGPFDNESDAWARAIGLAQATS